MRAASNASTNTTTVTVRYVWMTRSTVALAAARFSGTFTRSTTRDCAARAIDRNAIRTTAVASPSVTTMRRRSVATSTVTAMSASARITSSTTNRWNHCTAFCTAESCLLSSTTTTPKSFGSGRFSAADNRARAWSGVRFSLMAGTRFDKAPFV